ncbi:MAG: DNA-processing protein DprA [Treponema sp.]|jgi:DNA processing protein|nr:DNA-processing protein DprA [Treponema sp.]
MGERGLLDLIIIRIPGLSLRERAALCQKFDCEEELTVLSKEDIVKILNRPTKRVWNMDAVRAQAEKDEKIARLRGIRWVSLVQADYPPLLREIFDPPAVLFYRGSLPNPEKPLAAVVGTRRPTPGALAQAYDIGRGLAHAGLPVVSGLALGIDAMAHRGNLDGGEATIAVLGSAVDEVYPAANRMLARRIVEGGGALLSEYPPGTQPRSWTFPARNRIISALARGVLIVEAPEKSGALITAGFALEQGRDLWVASAGTGAAAGAGTAKLAGDGARIIYTAADILAEWHWECPHEEECSIAEGGGRALASSLARFLTIDLD